MVCVATLSTFDWGVSRHIRQKMADSSAKKTAPQLSLRFKKPENYPDVARFVDEDFDITRITNGQEEWNLQYEQEQLKEEEADMIKKDEEFFRRKRRQRRYYKRKQTLGLTNASGDLHMESKAISLDSAEEHDENLLQKRLDPSSVEDVPFRHVLLQFVKRQYEGGEQTEIHVIPVADVYAFRKKLKQKDQLLSDLDVAYTAQKEQLKKQNDRYRRLMQGMNDPTREDSSDRGGKGKRGGGEADADPFTFAVNRAFGRKRGANNSSSSSSANNNNQQPAPMLNENGVDLEELERENDFLGGDYNTRFADDEEEHIHIMQKRMDTDEGDELANNWRPEDDEMDVDDDDDEDDEEGEDGEKKKDITTSEAVSAVSILGSKNLKEAELQAARNFSMGIASKALKREPVTTNGDGSSSSSMDTTATTAGPSKSSLKRSRDDLEDTTTTSSTTGVVTTGSGDGVKDAKRVRFPTTSTDGADAAMMPPPMARTSQQQTSTSAASAQPVPPAATAASSSSAVPKSEFDLSMDGIRRFIRNQGGKVRTNILMEAFKPKMKAHSKQLNDKSAGSQLFLSIVNALTDTVEDPILGTVLALKVSVSGKIVLF